MAGFIVPPFDAKIMANRAIAQIQFWSIGSLVRVAAVRPSLQSMIVPTNMKVQSISLKKVPVGVRLLSGNPSVGSFSDSVKKKRALARKHPQNCAMM